MTTRRFFAPSENFSDHRVTLSSEETKHLRDVLRLRVSDEVCVFDGAGNEFLCLVQEFGLVNKLAILRILNEVKPTAPESNLNLTLAVALLKGEKFDLVVQKAVELGVSKLVPLNTKRGGASIINNEKKLARWQKIVIDATKQSGRAKLLRVSEPLDFQEFVETTSGNRVLFAERGGENFSVIGRTEELSIVIGSEGGWEESEIQTAQKNNFQIVTLNGRILRAETAAISIAAILQHRFGDLN